MIMEKDLHGYALAGARDRIRAFTSRHAELLQGYWDDETASFGLASATNAGNVSTSCTCALSLIDVPKVTPAPFFDTGRFTTWLLGTPWTSDNIPTHNRFTAPIALTTALMIAGESATTSELVQE